MTDDSMTDGAGDVTGEVPVDGAAVEYPDPAAGDRAAGGSGSFYGWLWRRLPGPWPARVAVLAAVALAAVVVLFLVVFPWLEPRLPFNHVTVDQGTGVPHFRSATGGWPL